MIEKPITFARPVALRSAPAVGARCHRGFAVAPFSVISGERSLRVSRQDMMVDRPWTVFRGEINELRNSVICSNQRGHSRSRLRHISSGITTLLGLVSLSSAGDVLALCLGSARPAQEEAPLRLGPLPARSCSRH